MPKHNSTLFRQFQLSIMTLVLASAAIYADNAHAGRCDPPGKPEASMRPGMRIDQQLDRLAQLLKLQPAQQAAWKAFAKARQDVNAPRAPLAENASIIDITADQADYASRMAVRMEVVSQTTRKLWVVLNAEQRVTLERVLARELPRGAPMMRPVPMD